MDYSEMFPELVIHMTNTAIFDYNFNCSSYFSSSDY